MVVICLTRALTISTTTTAAIIAFKKMTERITLAVESGISANTMDQDSELLEIATTNH